MNKRRNPKRNYCLECYDKIDCAHCEFYIYNGKYRIPEKPTLINHLFGLLMVVLFLLLTSYLCYQTFVSNVRLDRIERGETVMRVLSEVNHSLRQDGKRIYFKTSSEGIKLVHISPTPKQVRKSWEKTH
jgi:hypothetical protein